MGKEEKIKDLNSQIDNLNVAISDFQLEKRSLKIAEDQYRSAIMERDRNIKRQSNEIDQLTNRLADSAKMTDGIRRDKSDQGEEIFRLTTLIKKEKVQNEKLSEDILDLKKSNTELNSELSALKRQFNSQELELDQSNENYKKKIEELKQNDKTKEILMKTIEELRHKLLSKQAKVEEIQVLGENEIFQNKEALRIAREKNELLEQEIEEIRAKNKASQRSSQAVIENLEENLKNVRDNEIKSLSGKLTILTVENDRLNMDKKICLKKLKKERETSKKVISDQKEEIDKRKSRIGSLEPLIERLSFKIEELSSDRSKLSNRINDLEAENMRLHKELNIVGPITAG